MGTVIIHNGIHGEPLGTLPGPWGTQIPVYSLEPLELVAAMMEAIGHMPQPPSLELGGSVEVHWDSVPVGQGGKPQLVYNPSGDNLNNAKVAEYDALVSAWNARAAVIGQLASILVKQVKDAEKPKQEQ